MITDVSTNQYASTGYVNLLFAIFAAYWAQTTKRSSWLWFFFGLLLAPICGLLLLHKHSRDLDAQRPA